MAEINDRKDCFGNFAIINKHFRRLDDERRCVALSKKRCDGCAFYKSVNQVKKEFEYYGYPEPKVYEGK